MIQSGPSPFATAAMPRWVSDFTKFIADDDYSRMELNSRSLACFLAVAEHQSYTRAAAELGLSQPGVHQHIKRLEAELKTRLVEQHGKRVVLTEHGRVVYQYARRADDEEKDLMRYLSDDVSLGQGQLRIAAGTTSAEFILPLVAVAFQQQYPLIEIRIRATGTNGEVDAGVLDRMYDLGVHSDPAPRQGLDKAPFLGDTLVGIAPVGHWLTKLKRPATPEEVAREPFIHFGFADEGRMPPIEQLMTGWFTAGGVQPRSRLHIAALTGIKRAVAEGAGVGIISSYAIDGDDPRLATFRLASPPRREFVIVSRDRGWESNVVRSFREFTMSLCWAPEGMRQLERPGKAR